MNNSLNKIVFIICALLPIALGYSNYLIEYLLFNYFSDFNYQVIRDVIQLVFFLLIINILLSNTGYYNKHRIGTKSIKLNSIYIYVVLLIIMSIFLVIYNYKNNIESFYFTIILAVIYGPIIEGIVCHSLFSVVERENKAFITLLLVISSTAFAIMHCPESDINLTNLINNEITMSAFSQKYAQHFLYNIYLSIVTLYTRRIDLSIFLHAAQNLTYFI